MRVAAWLLTVGSTYALRVGTLGRWQSAPRTVRMGLAAEDMGIPCEGECALAEYPNLPSSIHPGVVTGQARHM